MDDGYTIKLNDNFKILLENNASILNLSLYDTKSFTNTSYMFNRSTSEILDITSIDTSNVVNMGKIKFIKIY